MQRDCELSEVQGPPGWQTQLDGAIDRRFELMVQVRRHIHANPEPSEQEFETSLYLYQLLSNEGLAVNMGPEGRGVIAEQGGRNTVPRIALRADIDALRIHDRKQCEYRSRREGVMHACGHDAHSATVLGAILGLADLERRAGLPAPVPWRAIFQPAEETATGAADMIAGGALEGIQAILATHVDPSRQVGQIGIRAGVLTANCDATRFVIQGRGGHAARPHESNDPIAAAAQLISNLYLFVPRATDSQDSVVITIGQLLGGDNPNAIPEQVELRGTLRTLDRAVRERTIEHIRQLARGIGETSGTTIDVSFSRSLCSVVNDVGINNLLGEAARSVVGGDRVQRIPRPSMGSEDFAAYLEHVPGAMFRLGCASPRVGDSGLHTPTFDVDEEALRIGAKVLARTAVLWSIRATSDRAATSGHDSKAS